MHMEFVRNLQIFHRRSISKRTRFACRQTIIQQFNEQIDSKNLHNFIFSLIFAQVYSNLFEVFLHLPGMHTHRKVPGSSRQLPSFWHGWLSHSLIFVSHRGPVNPCEQLQANEPGVFTQIPLCSQGDPWSHSSISSVQLTPLYPDAQEHVYDPLTGLVSQIASAWQGFDVQASSKWHKRPVLPGIQRQMKLPTASIQVAPLKQAASAQSSMFSLQSGPAHPLTQMHE